MNKHKISNSIIEMHAAIENELRFCIDAFMFDFPQEFKNIMEYQLGWKENREGDIARGKRIRPTVILSVCDALGGDWRKALPAAAAVELIHNFSLIHDDIQDHSLLRRGRDTVWVKWGEAQAINAGDAMLTLANLESLKLVNSYSSDITLEAITIFQQTCFRLTGGQYLDLAFSGAEEIELEDYWKMVEGKTGALISACFRLGALLAGLPERSLNEFSNLGKSIGVAFQVQDDWLGIWGEKDTTGKSITGDLLERKKTFPVIFALNSIRKFREYWISHPEFTNEDLNSLIQMLNESDAKKNTEQQYAQIYESVMNDYQKIFPEGQGTSKLRELLEGLINRSL